MAVHFGVVPSSPSGVPGGAPGGPAGTEAPRGLTFPKGSDLGLMMAMLMDDTAEAAEARHRGTHHVGDALAELLRSADSEAQPSAAVSRSYMMPVSSRPAVVKDVACQTLYVPYAEQRMDVIATALKHGVHPDSIRKVARELHGRWMRGDPYTMVISHVISDLNQPAHASENNREVTQFDHRRQPRPDCKLHHPYLPIDEDFLVADATVYIYAGVGKPLEAKKDKSAGSAPNPYPSRRSMPADMQEAYDRREELYVYNVTSKMSDVCMRALEQALHRPVDFNVDFIKRFGEIMHTHRRWLPKVTASIVHHLCAYNMRYLKSSTTPPPVKLHLVREGKTITVAFDRLESMQPRLVAEYTDQVHTEVAQQMKEQHPQCIACAVGARLVRCQHCGELRYCTEKCREHDFQTDHKFACKVYLKKTRHVTVPPGGPVVMQAKQAAV